MRQTILTVAENDRIADNTFRLRLRGELPAENVPGQFVNIQTDPGFLRRPISVCDAEGDTLTLLYKAVGEGTRWLSDQMPGNVLDVLTGLGNGFDLRYAGDAPLLLGGGIGTAPLYSLAKRLRAAGKDVTLIMGFRRAAEVFYENEFRSLGCRVIVTTEDGSLGTRGFVTDALPETYSYVYTCGPAPMLRAVYRAIGTSGQFSLEERMGCGFGACMGCSIETVGGYKRICRDGPVLRKEELLWKD